MNIKTHKNISTHLCGTPIEIHKNSAIVELTTSEDMAVDSHGLIHGGFVFGLADYAAMLAVNHPNVVLAGSSCKFLRPLKAGDVIQASAAVSKIEDHRYSVTVKVTRDTDTVFSGEFSCAILEEHVLGLD